MSHSHATYNKTPLPVQTPYFVACPRAPAASCQPGTNKSSSWQHNSLSGTGPRPWAGWCRDLAHHWSPPRHHPIHRLGPFRLSPSTVLGRREKTGLGGSVRPLRMPEWMCLSLIPNNLFIKCPHCHRGEICSRFHKQIRTGGLDPKLQPSAPTKEQKRKKNTDKKVLVTNRCFNTKQTQRLHQLKKYP